MRAVTITNPELSGALFNVDWYRSQLPTVSLENAVFHYLRVGWRYLLSPHPIFQPTYYIAKQRIDVTIEPLTHFLTTDVASLVSPHPEFDLEFYSQQMADDDEFVPNPLLHYLTLGWAKGLRPNRWFDPQWYAQRHEDVTQAGIEPFTHYLMTGRREGRAFEPTLSRSAGTGVTVDIASAYMKPNFDFNRVSVEKTAVQIYIHVRDTDYIDRIASLISKLKIEYAATVMADTNLKLSRAKIDFARYCDCEHISFVVSSDHDAALAPFRRDGLTGTNGICLKLSASSPARFGRQTEGCMEKYQDDLIGEAAQVNAIINAFQSNPEIGLIVPQYSPGIVDLGQEENDRQNLAHSLETLKINLCDPQSMDLARGSMFWFRQGALQISNPHAVFATTAQPGSAIVSGIDQEPKGLPLLACVLNGHRWTSAPRLYTRYHLSDETIVEKVRESGFFDERFYLSTYLDIALAGVDPCRHWALTGFKEGRDPNSGFSTNWYSRKHELPLFANINPIIHKLLSGADPDEEATNESGKLSLVPTDVFAGYKDVRKSETFVDEVFPLLRSSPVKVIAFYLPQFHPFEENNRFWGKGFTEWTNTSKAQPMFQGHHQPRLPGELGFYDTRLKETLVRQAELAKQFGIEGFCLHHYFFSGKPVMRAPYNIILANPAINIRFCLHWANEPWTVRFDGLSDKQGTLLEQSHEAEDDIAFFQDILPALRDPRYICIDGRPLLVIYRPALFPDMKATIERWRICCAEAELPTLYCATMHTGFEGEIDPRDYGLDAAVEFPPHNTNVPNVIDRVKLHDPTLSAGLYDYASVIKQALEKQVPDYPLFRGAMLEWDCTARRAAFGAYINYAPHRYERWLDALCSQAVKHRPASEQIVFINAWNEWAEGTYLEPDRRYGYAALQSTANAINSYERVATKKPSKTVVVVMHVFYFDVLEDLISQLASIPCRFDLLATTGGDNVDKLKARLGARKVDHCQKITVLAVPNFGFDIAPFLMEALPIAQDYDICCKIHTKKTPYNSDMYGWRDYLLNNLLGSRGNVAAIIDAFDDPKVGMVYPHAYGPVAKHVEWGSNYPQAASVAGELGIDLHPDHPMSFPSGSMFWCRPQALRAFLELKLSESDFGAPRRQTEAFEHSFVADGSLAHAIERLFDVVSRSAGFNTLSYSFTDSERYRLVERN